MTECWVRGETVLAPGHHKLHFLVLFEMQVQRGLHQENSELETIRFVASIFCAFDEGQSEPSSTA